MGFCLPQEFANKFIDALKNGKIDPDEMAKMTSADRREYLSEIVGKDDAREVNALFESKLLLKNQKLGMVTWAKQVAGISQRTRADIVDQITKLDRVLSPEKEQEFLEDLAAKKIGTDVTVEEAASIAKLAKAAQDAKDAIPVDAPIGDPRRLKYGAAKVALENEVNDMKVSNTQSVRERIEEAKKNPFKGSLHAASDIAGIAKGIKASLDNSALFRQGWRTLFTHPDRWMSNAVDSFAHIAKQLGRKPNDTAILDGIKAEIYSRPNAINGMYSKMKLDIGEFEEAYPTAIPEKIPLFGRLYKASETAYMGFLYRMRADIADRYIDIAKAQGVDLNDTLETQSVGRLVNSLTGRGHLGAFEKVGKQVNTIFFSPKLLKSQLDFLTLHAADPMSAFARKQAAKNLLKVTAGMAVILGTAKLLDPNSVDFDPRSSDFGQIRIGDTRFDVSGGLRGLVTLAARIVTLSSKSSVTGKVTKLNSGKYGAQTALDVAEDFALNKTSPATSVLLDYLKGQTFQGTKPSVSNEATNLLVPLSFTNAYEMAQDPNSANIILGMILDGLGISSNTYKTNRPR